MSKPGYLSQETGIEAGLNGWYAGIIVFGGLLGLLIIDPATGAMWRINEDSVNATLYPDTPEGRLAQIKAEELRIAAETASEAEGK